MTEMHERPIVYIVGAGPGDPGLLTLKAKEVIKKSDVLVYDALVSEEILNLIKNTNSRIEFIFVGKKPYVDDKQLSQEKIHELLLKLASENKIICRLKGGDPSVFGRVGEEAEFLVKNNINFEIVPGVSSVVAVPAYAGIPLTHRDCNSSFTVITAHRYPDDVENNIDWNSFDAKNNTLVLLMGTKTLPKIIEKLLSLGRDKETPIAVIYKGTSPEQKTWTSTLENVTKDLASENITHPALIVIGKVVNYKILLDWYEKHALLGKKILLTRSYDQSYSFSEKLLQHGFKPVLLPLVKYEIHEKEIFNKSIINNMNVYDWIFFTSQNAVKYFFEILRKNAYDSRILNGVKVAAVGYRTKQELEKYNITADYVPSKFSLKCLVEELVDKFNLKDEKILFPTQLGISHELGLSGVTEWAIYNANYKNDLREDELAKIKNGLDIITFFSSNNVKSFYSLINKYGLEEVILNSKIAVIGSETANTCREMFGRVDIIAEPFTEEGLILNILKYYKAAVSDCMLEEMYG